MWNCCPPRRSERSVALQATSALPITVIAPTPLQDGPANAPTVELAADGRFITPRSPDVPSMAEGESGGFTTFSLPTPTLTPRPPGVDEVSAECIHVVSGGDTVYGIALQYDSTVEDMRAANPSLSGDNPIIFPGQQLVIASCAELQSGDFASPGQRGRDAGASAHRPDQHAFRLPGAHCAQRRDAVQYRAELRPYDRGPDRRQQPARIRTVSTSARRS